MPRTRKPRKAARKSRKAPKKKIIIGMIYADWCGYCKELKPHWRKMKNKIKRAMGNSLNNVHISFHELGDNEVTREKGLTVDDVINDFNEKHLSGVDGVQYSGFPTLFKISKKRIDYYNGERKENGIYGWATDKL